MRLKINGREHEWDKPEISHEEIVGLAGKPAHASVAYFVKGEGDNERNGMTYTGKSIKAADGMVISAVVTGSA